MVARLLNTLIIVIIIYLLVTLLFLVFMIEKKSYKVVKLNEKIENWLKQLNEMIKLHNSYAMFVCGCSLEERYFRLKILIAVGADFNFFTKSTFPIKNYYCYHPWACTKFCSFLGWPFVKWRQPQCFDLAIGKFLSSAASGRQRRSVQLADLRVRQRKIINRRGSKPSGKLIACKFRAPLNKHTQSARFCPVCVIIYSD